MACRLQESFLSRSRPRVGMKRSGTDAWTCQVAGRVLKGMVLKVVNCALCESNASFNVSSPDSCLLTGFTSVDYTVTASLQVK